MRLPRRAGKSGGHEPPEGDDNDLLARSATEPAAFAPLVERYSAVLHGYLARRAPAAADDLLSEVWLRAFSGRSGFDPARGTVSGWLFGVARRVLATHPRDAPRRHPEGRPRPHRHLGQLHFHGRGARPSDRTPADRPSHRRPPPDLRRAQGRPHRVPVLRLGRQARRLTAPAHEPGHRGVAPP
ncbi:RNA polymerase sigma factor [Actinacidiphila yeochonensis]|uniref:RNA polymerase sigma factor n=1 Tax=Actinacidiphila yeochonensis TaxID=89050 RepID=UPI00099BF1AB|nr:sigma factor [Actinacidiphila yeochonensis]